MSFFSLAGKNLRRNFSLYRLYFLSVFLIVAVGCCFACFSLNGVILQKISSDGRVEAMCRTAAVFLAAFGLYDLFYYNRFFVRRRMRELGIYALLGCRKTDILRLLAAENLLVCLCGLLAGVPAGALLHRGVAAGIIAGLGLAIDSAGALLPPAALWAMGLFMLAAFGMLLFSNALLVARSSLLGLVRLEAKRDRPKGTAHPLPAALGLLLLAAGYALAVDIRRQRQSLWYTVGFVPVALATLLCVSAASALLICCFLPLFCRMLQRSKRFLYRETAILLLPRFAGRVSSHARSLIVLSLLSAGTMCVFGSTLLSIWYPYRALERIIPSAIEYRVESAQQRERSLQALRAVMGDAPCQVSETVLVMLTAAGERLPEEYFLGNDAGREPGFACISDSGCAALLKAQGRQAEPEVQDGQCRLIKYHPDGKNTDMGAVYRLQLREGWQKVTVAQTSLQNPIGFSNAVGLLVVSDALYRQLLASPLPRFSVISINGEGMRANRLAFEALAAAMSENRYLAGASVREQEFFEANSSTFLLVCFATILLLLTAGGMLYFQCITGAAYDRADYEVLRRLGYAPALLRRCVRREVQVFYLVPWLLGLLHSGFALFCYKSALMDDLLGGWAALPPVLLAALLFTGAYALYGLLTCRACYRIALSRERAGGR